MTLRLDPTVDSNLTMACRVMGLSKTDAVREAVLDYLAKLHNDAEFKGRVAQAQQDLAALRLGE